MKITATEQSKKYKEMIEIHIDGEFAFNLTQEDYLRLNLYEEVELNDERLEYIKEFVLLTKAKEDALRYLVTQIRTEQEVRLKLVNNGTDSNIAGKAIEELKAIGYINDTMYAQKFIYDRSKLKPKSKKMLKYELQNKGISEDIIDEVLDEWSVDESDMARALIKKKFGKYDLKDEKIKKKIYLFMQHRGFDYQMVRNLIQELMDE